MRYAASTTNIPCKYFLAVDQPVNYSARLPFGQISFRSLAIILERDDRSRRGMCYIKRMINVPSILVRDGIVDYCEIETQKRYSVIFGEVQADKLYIRVDEISRAALGDGRRPREDGDVRYTALSKNLDSAHSGARYDDADDPIEIFHND